MHRDLILAHLPKGASTDLASLMAREIVSHGLPGERPIPILQRAGYSGREIATHLDQAERLVLIATTGVEYVASPVQLSGISGELLREAV